LRRGSSGRRKPSILIGNQPSIISKKKDEGRRRYLKDNFDKDIDDPLLYHVIINTDLVQHDEAARLIGDEVIRRFKLNSPVKASGSWSRLT